MTSYVDAEHDNLSPEALELSAEELAGLGRAAEHALGISGVDVTGTDADDLKLAVALTVNHYVELGAKGWALSSDGRGSRSRAFRGTNQPPPAPLHAQRIADRVAGANKWPSMPGYA